MLSRYTASYDLGMIVNTALDMISIGKVAFDKAELSNKLLGHWVDKAVRVNPKSVSWCLKAEVLNIRLASQLFFTIVKSL
jgi:hypothetical protein